MTRQIFQLAQPVTLWSFHFIAVYALISAACAPRGIMAEDVMRAVAALITLGAACILLFWLMRGVRALRHVDDDAKDRPLNVAIVWTAGVSLLAILANLWPIATLSSCTG